MRVLGIVLIISFLFAGCKTETARSGCHYIAKAVDMSELDGCGILLELEDGERLIPVEWSVQNPDLQEGETYLINYTEIPAATICMAGKSVRMTCITAQ